MSQSKENKRGAGSFGGVELVTNIDDFLGKATPSVTNASAASNTTKKPASTAEKTRQEKIKEVLGVPTAKDKGKNRDPGWISSPAHASSSKDASLSTSAVQFKAPQSATDHPWMSVVAKSSSSERTTAGFSPEPQRHAPPAPSAQNVRAVSASHASNFPCTYADCKRGFRSLKDLCQHKIDEHDYCKVCDEDFDDLDALHRHKIASERHITCTVCSVDFLSEMGRDRHYTQVSHTILVLHPIVLAYRLCDRRTDRPITSDAEAAM